MITLTLASLYANIFCPAHVSTKYSHFSAAELVALIRSVKRDIWPTRTPPSGVQPWKNVNGSSLTR